MKFDDTEVGVIFEPFFANISSDYTQTGVMGEW